LVKYRDPEGLEKKDRKSKCCMVLLTMIMKEAILLAYKKGYRVTEEGVLLGVKGKPLLIKIRGKQKYPTFSVNGLKLVPNKNGVFGIPVHRFAAYCFYGDAVWNAECVRHKNGNTEDVSKTNIVLGTHSENNLDKDKSIRVAAAKKARAAQGKRPKNSIFTDEEVKIIRSSPEKDNGLAKKYGVTRQAIWRIRKGKNYGDVS
jgi:hypothetical protein